MKTEILLFHGDQKIAHYHECVDVAHRDNDLIFRGIRLSLDDVSASVESRGKQVSVCSSLPYVIETFENSGA